MKRYLCRNVLHLGNVLGLSVVEIDDEGWVSVSPFRGEQHSTSYYEGVIAVVREDALTEFLLDDLEMMLVDHSSAALSRVNDYLAASGLYPLAGEPQVALLL